MAETLEVRQARWDRLRNDPDFEPIWLKTMGPRPTAPGAHREWADGVGDVRPHVIAAISFAAGTVSCVCGWASEEAMPYMPASVEREWDIHRGVGDTVSGREWDAFYGTEAPELATDAEVSAFLRRVSDPTYAYEGE